MRIRRTQKRCGLCGAAEADAYICLDCGRELRELLIGGTGSRSQPGVVWYVKQLYKTAYRQTRMGGGVSARHSGGGYSLLAEQRALTLLGRIATLLAEWDDRVYTAKDRHGDMRVMFTLETGHPEALCIRQARNVAAHVRLLRRHDKDVVRLHGALLALARESWAVINRPPELCCGGCPTPAGSNNAVPSNSGAPDKAEKCGVILYAEENASKVQCPKCRTHHDVETLRDEMRRVALDYVLPAAELMTLMETRLNDRVPPSSFYALVRDGRLVPHTTRPDGVPLYTYQDVVAARAAGTKKPAQRGR